MEGGLQNNNNSGSNELPTRTTPAMSGDESSMTGSGVEGPQQTAAPHSSSIRLAAASVPQYATSGGVDEELHQTSAAAAPYSSSVPAVASAPQFGSLSTDGDKSKSDSGSDIEEPQQTALPPSSFVPATAADAASQNRASMGIENASSDDNDAPVPAAQIAASYKEMEDAIKSIENAEGLTPPPSPNGGYYGDIEDQKNTNMGSKLIQESKRPADPEPRLGSTSDVQQPSIDIPLLPAGHDLATSNQEDPPGSSSEVQITVPADNTSAAVNQGARLRSELHQPFTVAPAASSTPSRLTDDTQVGHDQGQITVVTRPPPHPMLAAAPNDQATTSDPTLHELEATLVDTTVYLATPLSDNHLQQSHDNDPTPSRRCQPKHMIVGLVLIIGVMAGIVGTLFLTRSNSDVNESISGIQEEATPSPSSSFVPSSIPTKHPSASPSGGPSRAQSALPSQIPTSKETSPSSSPSARVNALFETDCKNQCWPEIAISGDTAVVTRNFIDVQFFSSTNSTFELVTKIDIDYQPTAAAINGNTAVIGSSTENGDIGAVYVYEKDQLGIWYQVMRIVPSVISEGAGSGWAAITEGTLFGRDVAIYGGVMIVGADDDGEEGQGSVYIFRRSETTWIEEAKLTPPNNSTAEGFGYSVSVKGNTIVVGDLAYGDGQEGAVFVYEYESSSNSWIQSGSTLMNNGCIWFGSLVMLTYDEELLVSCRGNDRVYYYEKQEIGNEYVLQQSIALDNDVNSIAVDGNVMVVSEQREGRSEVIRFFERKNHVWEEIDRIDEPTFDESFGYQVALFGNATLVASHRNVYTLEDYFSS